MNVISNGNPQDATQMTATTDITTMDRLMHASIRRDQLRDMAPAAHTVATAVALQIAEHCIERLRREIDDATTDQDTPGQLAWAAEAEAALDRAEA